MDIRVEKSKQIATYRQCLNLLAVSADCRPILGSYIHSEYLQHKFVLDRTCSILFGAFSVKFHPIFQMQGRAPEQSQTDKLKTRVQESLRDVLICLYLCIFYFFNKIQDQDIKNITLFT